MASKKLKYLRSPTIPKSAVCTVSQEAKSAVRHNALELSQVETKPEIEIKVKIDIKPRIEIEAQIEVEIKIETRKDRNV